MGQPDGWVVERDGQYLASEGRWFDTVSPEVVWYDSEAEAHEAANTWGGQPMRPVGAG
jgi:hypothetical protein